MNKFDNGHWNFTAQLRFKECTGFVYLIRDKVLGGFYIGKKAYKTAGIKNSGLQSNWRSYASSSKWMNELMSAGTESNFEFHVLEEYSSKGMLSYAETWSLCQIEAPTRKDCHSKRIEHVHWKVSEKITERHRERLLALSYRRA